mgnify:CR=1 FL=1|jgi:hypothetical protein
MVVTIPKTLLCPLILHRTSQKSIKGSSWFSYLLSAILTGIRLSSKPDKVMSGGHLGYSTAILLSIRLHAGYKSVVRLQSQHYM